MTTPEKCKSVGDLIVGGRKVGLLRCELDAGHDEPVYYPTRGEGLTHPVEYEPGEPHTATLTWRDDAAIDWPEALDPDESFDIEVELAPEPPHEAPTLAELRDDRLVPAIPSELCGKRGCVYLKGHQPIPGERMRHSWEK